MNKSSVSLLLLLICQQYFEILCTNLRTSNVNSDNIKQTRKLYESNQVMQLKAYTHNASRRTAIINVVYDVGRNSLTIDGTEYLLDNVEPISIVSPNFVIMTSEVDMNILDDESLTKDTLWSGMDGNIEILLAKDMDDQISLIDIFDGENVTSLVADSTSGDFIKVDNLPDENVEIDPIHNDSNIYNISDVDIPSFDPNDTSNIFLAQSGCGKRRVIDIAIATTADFCAWAGGFQATINKVKTIVALSSNKYNQQGICIKLKLSAVDVRCDRYNDPYNGMRMHKSGCYGSGLLDDFRSYWDTYMKHIPRDTAHLFHTRQMDGPLGCASQGDLCRRNSYGVEYMASSNDINMQGVLLTHEVGHNIGATHLNGGGYIMNSYLGDGRKGWASNNVYGVSSYLNAYGNCLK